MTWASLDGLCTWLARYESDGLEGLGNRSCRPVHCPHQMPVSVEAKVLEMRRTNQDPSRWTIRA